MAEPLKLPAPAWATEIDGESRSGITWRRAASIKPLAEPDWVDQPRGEAEVVVERYDLIDRTAEGFVLAEGRLLFFVAGTFFDHTEAHRLHAALGELLGLVDPEGGSR